VAIKDIRDSLKRLKDADPVELASQVNGWIQESGEAIRLRVEDEVEKAVTKRGFVKRSEFLKLEARISALEGKPKRAARKVDSKKATVKKSAKSSTKTNAKGKK
jgi:hypothetical protein